jgi:hypothetical protein
LISQIATVEVTSEDPSFPIESVFGSKDGPGWRASEKGEQQIWIIFAEPVTVQRSFVSMRPSPSERRNSLFDGRLLGAAR